MINSTSIFPPPSPCPKAKVKPSCGRLVGFSSGPVNPHGVTAVTSGRRCALALWFTKEKLYRDMVRAVTPSHSADLCPAAVRWFMLWHPRSITQACGVWCKTEWLVSCCGIHNAQSFITPCQFTLGSSHICLRKYKTFISDISLSDQIFYKFW